MPECIGVRFDNGPKLHYVEAPSQVPPINQLCVVSTRRGLELATVRTSLEDQYRPSGHFVREAFEDDVEVYEKLKDKAEELKWFLKARARQANLPVKIVRLEFNLEESLLVVHYSAKDMLDLRPFIRELLNYTAARIEFHNVGPRDEVTMIGALGMCGTGTCSSTWLQGFATVGIRMAREQQLPLNPEKISGPCGRLMCCLQFEHDMYLELLDEMPRRGTKACHEHSGTCGRIVKLYPIKQSVEIESERGIHEFPLKELNFVNALPQTKHSYSHDEFEEFEELAPSNAPSLLEELEQLSEALDQLDFERDPFAEELLEDAEGFEDLEEGELDELMEADLLENGLSELEEL